MLSPEFATGIMKMTDLIFFKDLFVSSCINIYFCGQNMLILHQYVCQYTNVILSEQSISYLLDIFYCLPSINCPILLFTSRYKDERRRGQAPDSGYPHPPDRRVRQSALLPGSP